MIHSAYGTAGERPLRRDARENRDRILAAAREAFAELGMEASVEEIAARAGVGVGTFYRRFPTKDALAEAVFEAHLDRVAEAATEALEAVDPWKGLLDYLTHVVGLQAADRGLSEIMGAALRSEEVLGRARTRLRPLVEELIARARNAGDLRADVTCEDVSVLLWTTGRVVDATSDIAPVFWRRYLALLVDGLRSGSATPLPRAPLTRDEHAAAMRAFNAQRRRGA
jgi:AcrR family transcriptional regulator